MGACFAVSVESNFRKHTCSDGQVYEGEWKHGRKNGKGKYTYPSGNIYEGGFKDDKFHGKGKFT